MKGTTKMVTTSSTPTLSSSGVSTSTGQQIGTVTVTASTDETKTTIAALLSLGSDILQPEEDVTAENAQLMPINPEKLSIADADDPTPAPLGPSAETKMKPVARSSSVLIHRRLVTKEYKLKCRLK